MPRFYGYRSVIASLRKHKLGTGKVTSATLKVRGSGDTFADVAYKNAYRWPSSESSGLTGSGYPHTQSRIVLWRLGETTPPRVDDKVTLGGTTFLIVEVTPRLNADEDRNYAVYDLTAVS